MRRQIGFEIRDMWYNLGNFLFITFIFRIFHLWIFCLIKEETFF